MAYGVNAPFGLRPVHSINGGSWTEKTNPYNIFTNAEGTVTYGKSIFTGDPVIIGTSVNDTMSTDGSPTTIAVYDPHFVDGTPSTFSTASIVGVFMGCEYIGTGTSTNNAVWSSYWPANTQVQPGSQIIAYVIDDPDVVFDIQISTHVNAINNAFAANPVFPNTNITGGAPFHYYGGLARNFALNIGGGTNFNTIINPFTGRPHNNNPTAGNISTGSAFYLDVDTSTAVNYNADDYYKDVTTLPLRVLGYTQHPKNVAAPGLTMGATPFLNVRVMLNNRVWANGSTPVLYKA